MADGCCQLVGNLSVGGTGVFSIQVSSSTEVQKLGDTLIIGPTLGNINISAYASDTMHIGCPGNANVSLNWIYKYDCDQDTMYILYDKGGKATISGNIGGLAKISESANTYSFLNASAAGGPASIYESSSQEDGFGLSFTGDPWPFDTSEDEPASIEIKATSMTGEVTLKGYIKSFSLQCQPGSLPVATYSLLYTPMTCVVG